MNTILIILTLLVALVISAFISRAVPVPRPLLQIAVGALLGLATDFNIVLNPEIFFLLIVPPLLFFDGWRIPNEDLLKEKGANLQLALGLVALTVIGIGELLYMLIPNVPRAICFAFAAAVSPTDAIAVGSMTRQTTVPRRLMRILTGESLLNDSTGLVCLRLSLVAAATGEFSLAGAAGSFLWVASAGAAIGFALAWLVAHGSNWLANRLGEEASLQVMVSLLIPFAAYLLAEQVHGSGVLAAAAAGIAMSYTDSSGTAHTSTRMQRAPVWETIQFTASGVAFVLLGAQLPDLLRASRALLLAGDQSGLWWLLICIVAINAGILLLRTLWIMIAHFLARQRSYVSDDVGRLSGRSLAIMVLASPRGAITLAGVMTLPLMLHGRSLPERDLVILLAMGVIVLSLIIASIALPLLLRGVATADVTQDESENLARVMAARAALEAVKRIQGRRRAEPDYSVDHERVTLDLIKLYESIIQSRSRGGAAAERQQQRDMVDRELRVQTIQAERDAIFELLKNQQITSEVANKLILELDLLETHHDVNKKVGDV